MDQPRGSGPPHQGPRRLHHACVVRPPAGPTQLVELSAAHLPCHPRRQSRQPDRPLPRSEDRLCRHHVFRPRRQGHADPSRDLRADGPAADSRRDRRVRSRLLAGGFRQGGRPPAGLASLRRTLRPPLDGPRPLRRYAWQRRRSRHSAGLALSRLPDPGVQYRRALRPVRTRTPRRRPAAEPSPQRGREAQ